MMNFSDETAEKVARVQALNEGNLGKINHELITQLWDERNYWKERADEYGGKWLDMTQEYNDCVADLEKQREVLGMARKDLDYLLRIVDEKKEAFRDEWETLTAIDNVMKVGG